MRDVVRYVNSAGDEQLFSTGGCLCNTKALREFLYTVQNKRLYSNQEKTITIELLFHGSPTDRDAIIDILEVDSIKNTYGKLYVNDWYILCRFVGISSIEKEGLKNIRMNLQFVADTIEWSCETHYELEQIEDDNYNDYPNDYANDYPNDYAHDFRVMSLLTAEIENNEIAKADIRVTATLTADMIATGKIEFIISDSVSHTYTVNISNFTVIIGSEFILDTQDKIVEIDGINVFSGTADDYYIFEKINTGASIVESNYPISVDVIEHRRQPKWMT